MPVLPSAALNGVEDDALRVLVTGFGPFARFSENPSWLAVKTLQNTILSPEPPSEPVILAEQTVLTDTTTTKQRQIHISALQVPVIYSAVLGTVPSLHARPPVLPTDDDFTAPIPPPPTGGYDLILHVGVAGPGALRVESLAHKVGYKLPDVDGELAPIVEGLTQTLYSPFQEEQEEQSRLQKWKSRLDRWTAGPVRGFGEGYESFADELHTDLDTAALVGYLEESGVNVRQSTDAGRYLCDFIYYCSLAEACRTEERTGACSKVLFLHCPPVGDPLSTEDVTDAIKKIILWHFSDAI